MWGGTRSDPVPPLFRRLRAAPSPRGRSGDPLLGEGGPGKARDGCGAVQGRTWYRPSSAAAAAPSPRGRSGPSPGRGWTGQSPGRVWGRTGSDLVPPLFRRCGGTFPQGKVRGFLPSVLSSAPRFFRFPLLMLPGNRTSVPAGGSGSGGGRWSGRKGPRCSPGSRAPR